MRLSRWPSPGRGTANHQARLADPQVETIRRARAAGTPLAPIAQRFGISVSQVSRIAARKSR
jgi:hypothetical protein